MSLNLNVLFLTIGLLLIFSNESYSENKYSEHANTVHVKNFVDEPNVNMRHIDKPFRMAKLNMLWAKAQVVSILNINYKVSCINFIIQFGEYRLTKYNLYLDAVLPILYL